MRIKRKRKPINQPHDVFKRVDIPHTPEGEPDKQKCWEWKGKMHIGKGGEKRGRFTHGGNTYFAHRVVYEQYYGTPIPDGQVIRHRCDNSLCCNPFHLEIGTQRDNIEDRTKRERIGRKHIHIQKIMQMIEIGLTSPQISQEMLKRYDMNIDDSMIRKIKLRQLYTSIPWEWGDEYAKRNRKG